MLDTVSSPEFCEAPQASLQPPVLEGTTRSDIREILNLSRDERLKLRSFADRMRDEIAAATNGGVQIDARTYEAELAKRLGKSGESAGDALTTLERDTDFTRELTWIVKKVSPGSLARLNLDMLSTVQQSAVPLASLQGHPQGDAIIGLMQSQFPDNPILERLLQHPEGTVIYVTTCGKEILSAIAAIPMSERSVYLDWFSKNESSPVRSLTQASLHHAMQTIRKTHAIAAHVDPQYPVAEWIIENGGARSVGIDAINGHQYLSVILDPTTEDSAEDEWTAGKRAHITSACDAEPHSLITLQLGGNTVQCMALDVTSKTRSTREICDARIQSALSDEAYSLTHVFKQTKGGSIGREPRRYLVFEQRTPSSSEAEYGKFLDDYYGSSIQLHSPTTTASESPKAA